MGWMDGYIAEYRPHLQAIGARACNYGDLILNVLGDIRAAVQREAPEYEYMAFRGATQSVTSPFTPYIILATVPLSDREWVLEYFSLTINALSGAITKPILAIDGQAAVSSDIYYSSSMPIVAPIRIPGGSAIGMRILSNIAEPVEYNICFRKLKRRGRPTAAGGRMIEGVESGDARQNHDGRHAPVVG